mmetsp:Transcript_25797/g.60958  ORF Transcript_25797/g.60958 Transcript_25797/m.60958 type:complete len:599 (-) Transcript_25797:135-1931(-)
MTDADISEGARELVDLTAESVEGMGVHLAHIGDIIAGSAMPPKKGERGASRRLKDKLDIYRAFCADVVRRRQEAETKMAEDFERLREWRKEAGTEGQSMIEEMEALFDKVRLQKKLLDIECTKAANERQKVRMLVLSQERQARKKAALSENFVERINSAKAETMMRATVCSWLQCSFDNQRYRWRSQQEAQKLKIEFLRKLRHTRAQARLDCVHRTQDQRRLQACLLSFQEETVERRQERHLEEIRRRYEDHVLILEAQIAQALGDEEKAKALINEQVRRLEEAKERAKEAERLMRLAQRETREAKADAERARLERDDALEQKAAAEARAEAAENDAREARAEAAEANARADASDDARIKAEKAQRKAEDEVRKKTKKIQSLQRMLAEIGAESDSDAPPDERPPSFFINEDGSKAPRPRTRKERMGMAYREAESSRWELRLGMAAMIDKDISYKDQIENLRLQLRLAQREVSEVRRANESLAAEAEAAAAAALADAGRQTAAPGAVEVHASLPELPLAPSSAVSAFSPQRPVFEPAPLVDMPSGSPRLLVKTASQPIFMPSLHGGGPGGEVLRTPEKLALAPLRKLKRPPNDWRVGWH